MRHKMITASILAGALSVFAVGGAVAQQDEHHPQNQTTQNQSKPGTTAGGMMGMMGMMSQMNQMNQMMGQMTTHQQQMSGLMNKLMDSMKAIETEKDPAALKQKLAEHRALLDQMRGQMMQQGGMMQQMMGGAQNAPTTGSGQPPAAK